MALPIAVGDASTHLKISHQRGGPFYASGAVYVFAAQLVGAVYQMRAFKASSPTLGFTAQNTAGETAVGNAVQNFAAVLSGGKIHVAVMGQSNTYYLVFDPATDTWTTNEVVVASIVANTVVDIAVRSTGEVVIARQVSGGSFCGYYRRTGVNTWTGVTNVSSGNANFAGCALGASDRIHFFYVIGTNFAQRALTAANALQTEQTLGTGVSPSNGNLGGRPGSYAGASVTRLIVGWLPTAATVATVAVADSADAPAWTTTATALDDTPQSGNGASVATATNDDNEYVGYTSTATARKVRDAARAKAGAFGVDAIHETSGSNWQFISTAVYYNGTDWKLGLLYGDTGGTRYTERTITGPAVSSGTVQAQVGTRRGGGVSSTRHGAGRRRR